MENKLISEKQKETLGFLVETLNKNSMPFQISGGLAALAHGARRPLYDIDIDIHQSDIPKVRKIFAEYIVEDFQHLQSENFDVWLIYLEINGVPVDISQIEECYFVDKSGHKIRMDAKIEDAQLIEVEGIAIPVESKESLIAYKKIIARDTDLIDVEQLEI